MLRALYAVVFLGLAAAALTGSSPELSQLWTALTRPLHFGDPPKALVVTGAFVVAVAAAGIIIQLLRRRTLHLWLSIGVLAGVVLAYIGTVAGPDPAGRTWMAADHEILQVASRVHRVMVDQLQAEGAVPRDVGAWQRVLGQVATGGSPARTRSFARVPYSVTLVDGEEAAPPTLEPGALVVHVAPEGEAFRIRPVGFDAQGDVAFLHDPEGQPIVLTGTFNPDLKPAPARPQVLPSIDTRPMPR